MGNCYSVCFRIRHSILLSSRKMLLQSHRKQCASVILLSTCVSLYVFLLLLLHKNIVGTGSALSGRILLIRCEAVRNCLETSVKYSGIEPLSSITQRLIPLELLCRRVCNGNNFLKILVTCDIAQSSGIL